MDAKKPAQGRANGKAWQKGLYGLARGDGVLKEFIQVPALLLCHCHLLFCVISTAHD
jgi:hypothetical protein